MVTNVPGTLPDPETFWQRPEDEVSRALVAAEPLASLLGEQLLILQRIERSLETLMTLGTRQANALEALVANQTDMAPDAPKECREHLCDYYRDYLAYGPADLTHEGYHAACKLAGAHFASCTWDYTKAPTRADGRTFCPRCDEWEKRIRA